MIQCLNMRNFKTKLLEFIAKHKRKFEIFNKIFWGISAVFIVWMIYEMVIIYFFDPKTNIFKNEYSESSEYSETSGYAEYYEYADTGCNVVGINLHGSLYTYIPEFMSEEDVVSSEEIMLYLISAEKDDAIKAVMIEVDSPGGYPVAGEEVAQTIQSMSKPVIAYIRQTGTSAAYWSIITADKIFASKNSDIGSIGVTISYLENVTKNEKDGFKYVELTSGKYKDMGSADRVLTQEEKAIIMRDLEIVHENFIQDISKARNIPIPNIRAIADGSSVLGEAARELGLIDEIGGYLEVREYIEEIIGEESTVCW